MVDVDTRAELPAAEAGTVRALLAAVRAAGDRVDLAEDAPSAPGNGSVLHLTSTVDGRLAGYARLDLAGDVFGNPVAELAVHPELRRRGAGAALVAALLDRPESDRLRIWAHGEHPGAVRLAGRFGLHRVRAMWRMRAELTAGLPEPTLPEHVRIRPYVVGQDEVAVVEVNAKAFSWHPEQGRMSVADLRKQTEEGWFDAAGFLLAVDSADRVIGFHWTKVHPGERPMGEVYVVGVDPAAHGNGLGTALTLAVLRHLAGRGLRQVMLYVEADNAAAIAVYRRLGFTHWDTDVQFAR